MITAVAARDLFWFAAGLMSALAALFLILPLLPRVAASARLSARAMLWPAVAMVALGAVALALYLWQGSPNQLSVHGAGVANPASAGTQRGGSIEGVLNQLEQRLRQQGGSAADWGLLAQTYDFLGRSSDAQHARSQHRVAGDGALSNSGENSAPLPPATASASTAPAGAEPAAQMRVNAGAQTLLTQAEHARRARDYVSAVKAYRQLETLGSMSADSWADYADAAASLNAGRLAGAPERFIAAALTQDPNNEKALWLLASLQHEKRQYPEAIASWKRLLAQAPSGSSDARIFADNLAEDQGLAGAPESAASAEANTAAHGAVATAPSAGSSVQGRVELADALRAQVTPGLTVFIVAKSLDSPGPPVAVLRSATGAWPLAFRLDDSLAMVPGRSLSTAGRVSVQARVSRTGFATPAPGDLQSAALTVDPSKSQPVRLVIDQAVR